MLKRTITWVSSMSYIGKTCRKHWPNITRIWISVGATIVLSGSSARRDDKPARLARHVTAQRAYCRFSDSSRLSRESRLARLPIRPRPPEGAPVRSPILIYFNPVDQDRAEVAKPAVGAALARFSSKRRRRKHINLELWFSRHEPRPGTV